jgi:hypothetical protein
MSGAGNNYSSAMAVAACNLILLMGAKESSNVVG